MFHEVSYDIWQNGVFHTAIDHTAWHQPCINSEALFALWKSKQNGLKVEKIYKVGGAQAIAALAFGTKTIPKVDKIVGPGNIFVTEAKRQVFGYTDIEMTAGPSEIVIIANNHANPEFVKADLMAQAEHAMGVAILITTSKSLANKLKNEVKGGYIIRVDNLNQAVDIANKIAPEHLEIMVKSPYKILRK